MNINESNLNIEKTDKKNNLFDFNAFIFNDD